MKRIKILLLGIFCVPCLLFAQDSTMSEGYTMVELIWMKAKVGMEEDFVKAVHKHNEKYHPEGPYQSALWTIAVGEEAGWFVWSMGPVTFTELDGAPGMGDHSDDWRGSVSEYVSEYGRTEYWRMMPKFSTPNADPDMMFTNWLISLEDDAYDDFKEFMEKVHVIHEKHPEEEMKTWYNVFWGNGRDIAINWTMDSWADMDKEDWDMEEEYDAEYGKGAWMRALDDWMEFTAKIERSVWRMVPPEKK